MAKKIEERQAAIKQACKMAGFDVVYRDPSKHGYSIMLTDEQGRKYTVVDGAKIKQVRAAGVEVYVASSGTKIEQKASVAALRNGRMKSRRATSVKAKKKVIR
jgi:hypothetical protein